ncbi:MAG TPA: ubiquinol-cytochrome c reductase iron-sulfur subunit [Caulobacteraceae bacterium]|nr:ubiquinol-cytochrome c reductase iron-sulfur subunit [Caulobacteraceae bacterium]
MSSSALEAQSPSAEEPPSRRDFIYIATGAMAAGGAVAAVWPLIDQLEPAADTIAGGLPLKVDISKIEPGAQITVFWRKNPIFVVRRTPAMLARIRQPSDLKMLRDPHSTSKQQPAYAQNWSRSIKPEYLVLIGVCTHLGCTPNFEPGAGALGPTWPGGWLCPCHGSRYDLAGRVFKSVPAPLNLPVPPYSFESPTSLIIGQNPPAQAWSMSDINTL